MADGIVGKISVGDGATFTPHVDADGILTFTNNKNLPNPDPFDIPAKVLELGPSVLGLAPLASPAFTGNPTAPTQAVNDNSTRLATTAYVVNDLKANAVLTSNALATQIQSGDDLNNYKTAGTYYSNGASVSASLQNCPWTTSGFKMVVMITHTAFMLQILYTYGNEIFMRGYNASSGNWFEWTRLARADKVLPLAGGTMTGNIIREASSTPSPIVVQRTDIERGAEFTGTKYNTLLSVYDKNGLSIPNRLAVVENVMDNTTNKIYLTVWQNISATANAQIYLEMLTSNGERNLGPTQDNLIALGKSSQRWKQLFAGTTTISTSDERLKDNIVAIPDEVLDAWGEVDWYQYQFKDSIEEKGETKARIHTGAIAQRIESVFESHGLDANRYGLLCYDEWKSEPAERDEDGNVVQEARPAGDRYSLRYEEALCMEAAYQRRRADRLEERIARLEALFEAQNE